MDFIGIPTTLIAVIDIPHIDVFITNHEEKYPSLQSNV